MTESVHKARFGPGFFWLLIVAGWLLIMLGVPDERAGSTGIAFLFGLFSIAGLAVNAWRWRRLSLGGRIGLVLLILPFVLFYWFFRAFSFH